MGGEAYYNEFDPKAAAWLRELIREGLIPDGEVDQRDIREVKPADVRGFTACHFFAGIGGWAYALRLAGWPDGEPVWTGSCPCQPFSAAGKRKGADDERHLWPAWFALIRECRPDTILGEQVASADALDWLDGVRTDLEGAGYALGAADLCAAGAGAPHLRQRLWWVGHAEIRRRAGPSETSTRPQEPIGRPDLFGRLADVLGEGLEGCDAREVGHECEAAERGCTAGRVGDTAGSRRDRAKPGPEGEARDEARLRVPDSASGLGFWRDFDLIPCLDGKARRVESGTFPLADGVPARVGRLRGYGNAIVPQVAAEFVRAYREARVEACPAASCGAVGGGRGATSA